MANGFSVTDYYAFCACPSMVIHVRSHCECECESMKSSPARRTRLANEPKKKQQQQTPKYQCATTVSKKSQLKLICINATQQMRTAYDGKQPSVLACFLVHLQQLASSLTACVFEEALVCVCAIYRSIGPIHSETSWKNTSFDVIEMAHRHVLHVRHSEKIDDDDDP